jgi:kelch-like protein 10
VKDHPYVMGNDKCRPIIIDTLKFLYDLEMIAQRDGEIQTPGIARPRVPYEILFAIGGWSGGSPTNFVETYDTRADRWVKVRAHKSTKVYLYRNSRLKFRKEQKVNHGYGLKSSNCIVPALFF